MTNRFLAVTGLLLATPCAWAQEASTHRPAPPTSKGQFYSVPAAASAIGTTLDATEEPTNSIPLSERSLTRRVDDFLRGSGSKLALDQDTAIGSVNFRTTTNKVIYHTSTKEKRMVRIDIEPVGEETPGSSKLAATFLTVLNAVESVEDGVKLAELLTKELAKDGLTRSVGLGNGMKFMKEKKGDSSIRYIIVL